MENIKELISAYTGATDTVKTPKIIEDLSDFFTVQYDDVVVLGERPYLIRGNQREGRFGIDDEPKFWVRNAIDLIDRKTKVIKMVFTEEYNANIGGILFRCIRSPKKEARVLEKVNNHERFMHGFGIHDKAGNTIRVIDYIKGINLTEYVLNQSKNHEEYYFTKFKAVFEEFIELVKAIEFLHDSGEKHGDIRRDHVIMDSETGIAKWIDFDYTFINSENRFGFDLFGLGNILIFITGGGDVTLQQLSKVQHPALKNLVDDDLNVVIQNRVANLKKIFPYIGERLNYVLLHFSQAAEVFYETAGEFLSDLLEV
ncbi:MAG: serine/threonine protein kinase, partial [Nitrospirae bacterium]|nr:serine/threonine protein kinase [Nitrospirota bacterium]